MQIVKVKKGFKLKLAGAPQSTLVEHRAGSHAGVDLHGLTWLKPRLQVAVGQKVKNGEILFHDKARPALKFLAPAAGKITAIKFGHRRRLEQIVIQRDDRQTAVSFPSFDEKALACLSRDEIVTSIADGGLWYTLKELPFRIPASLATEPTALFVSLDNLEPYQPDPKVYLAGQEDLFAYGLKVLRRLCPQDPTLIIAANNRELADKFTGEKLLGFNGLYPAHDPAVLLYHTKKSAAENHAWYIDGQDVIAIGSLLRDGRYPTQRIYAVGGVPVPTRHVKAPVGARLAEITGFAGGEHWRTLAGSVFNGYLTQPEAFAGPQDKAFFVINAGDRQGRFIAWMLFGMKATTSFRAHLSAWLPRRRRALNCNMHGGLRSCIACNQCARLCPVDILPSLAWKALLAGETEEALAHGLLDCVECGLCSYGCPSKIELTAAFVEAKAAFNRESA